jgi:hypothetical protein
MLKTKLVLFSIFMLVFFSVKSFSQDSMQLPKPLDVKVFDAMIGQWEGTNQMMGMMFNQKAKVYWILNKQFLAMEVENISVDKPDMKYSGIGYFSVDKDGKVKSWWFDDWGAEMTMSGAGIISDMKFTSVSSGPMNMKDDRAFEVKGDELIMTATSTWNENGKEQKSEGREVFKKK